MTNIAAIYCRLSREDGDVKESNSITAQKELLSEYAKDNGFTIHNIYVDDGYSGTNFDRPGFQKMLSDADKQLFNIILVKDLSRFGRNYIQTGYFTEEYFPERNIRIIAINDNYDTSKSDNDFVPIKNIVNEWYAKDISKKIRSTHKLHQEQGIIPTGKLPLYGYMYDKDRNRIPDNCTAHIVKEVFELYIDGKTREEIAQILTDRKYLVPGYYYYEKYGYYAEKFSKYTEEQKYHWIPNMVGRIIGSREYTGNLHLGKSYIKSFKSNKEIYVKAEEQKIHIKRFPPLISEELYETAAKIRTIRKRDQFSGAFEKKFYGLFKCYDCGSDLKFKGFTIKRGFVTGYICLNPKCPCRTFVYTEDALALLDKELSQLKKILLKKNEFIEYCAKQIENIKEEDKPIDRTDDIKKLKIRNAQIDKLIEKLFEESTNNRIPKSAFDKMMKKYSNEYQQNEKQIEELSKVPKKTLVDYKELAIQLIHNLDSLRHNRDLVWLLKIFNGILIRKRRKINCLVCYDYGEISKFIEVFKDEYNEIKN